jgi:hypothetical protein
VGEPSIKPEIHIDTSATDEQRTALAEFELIASTMGPGVVEAALQIEARAPNLMPLVRRVVREEVGLVFRAWQTILATNAHTEILGFDTETERRIDEDEEHRALLAARDLVVVQSNESRGILPVGKPSRLVENLKTQKEEIRLGLTRRNLSIFAGRVAVSTEKELAEPA